MKLVMQLIQRQGDLRANGAATGTECSPLLGGGHRSGACGIEDNVMNTLRKALAVWGLIYLLLSH